jgi:hypothetical protein
MQAIGLLFIVVAIVGFVFMVAVVTVSHVLFRSLQKGYASYYKSIGEPDNLIFSKLSDTEEDFVRNYTRMMKSGWYMWRLVIKGTPEDFPKDVRPRNLAKLVRVVGVTALVLWFAVVTLILFMPK